MKAAFLRFERPRLRSRQGLLRGNQLLDVGIPGRQKIDFFTIPCGRHADRFRDALLFTAHNLFGRKIPVKHRRGAGHKKETRYFFKTISTSKQQIAPNVRMSGYRKSNLRPFSYQRLDMRNI